MKTIKEITDNLVRDLCSVEFRTKSKTRELINNYRLSILYEIDKWLNSYEYQNGRLESVGDFMNKIEELRNSK